MADTHSITCVLAALRALVDEPQPLGIDRPAYQAALALVVAADEANQALEVA